MEKYTLSPTTREITVNRDTDAADDLFSYAPETNAQARSLGHLFVVGHTAEESGPAGYLVSLIAAMAKREYYASQPAGDAKQSFARMLRKVNEVVEEFFKTNEIAINVGIFAIAGNSLYVSRLGKFRVLLARDKKVVDVLKDVSLFSKEVVQKHRFSSIISGPVHNADRYLAYFPQLAITRREKVIRTHLPEESPQEFSDRLAEFGKKSPTFSCSLLHIDVSQVPVPDAPASLTPADAQARLAWRPRQHAPGQAIQTDAAVDVPPGPVDDDVPSEDDIEPRLTDAQETPNIIPSEFTHRRRGSLTGVFRNVRVPRSGSHGKALILGIAVLAVIGGTYAFKSFLFTDESKQQLRAALNGASEQLAEAQERISADRPAARAQVLAQLSVLEELRKTSSDDEVQNLYGSFIQTLDEIDRAEPATVTLIASIPTDEGTPRLATIASGSNVIWLVADSPTDPGFVLLQVVDGEVTSSEALDMEVDLFISAPPSLLLGDTSERTFMLHNAQAGPHTLPTPDRIIAGHWFLDYAYLLTGSGILKVEDLETVKPVTKQWLSDVSELADGARLIAVDGDAWTLSQDGTLTKYYRGDQVEQSSLALTISGTQRLLTVEDMPFMYVTDAALRRVHVIDKETMALIHTVTVDTEQDVQDFFMDSTDFSLYMLASDGKIWRVE